jgi:hypothetical protein
MLAAFQMLGGNAVVRTADVANVVSVALYAACAELLAFPLGVYLHWTLARRTGVFPPWARRALFWGGLFMCFDFPVGTMMGVATLWLLIRAETFRERQQNPKPEP